MPLIFWFGLIVLGVFDAVAATNAPSPSAAPAQKLVYVIPVRTEVSAPMVYIVRRGVKEAERANADAVVLDMDTNGGRADAMEEISDVLNKWTGDSFTFVDTKAYSAGAFIAVSTKHIYMAPGSVIGAATPVMLMPTGETPTLPESYEKKITSAFAAKIRAVAERNGYNPSVVEKMVDRNAELIIDGKSLKPKNEILTLTNTEAEKPYGQPPKPLLSSGTVKSIDELLTRNGYEGAELKRIEPSGAETIAEWINLLSPLLLALGALGIYIEFKLQTFGMIGVLAVGCLLLFFFGQYIAGLSGYEYALLFLVGVVLLVVEVFVLPGHLISGMFGTICILVAVLMAMVDQWPGGPWVPDFPDLKTPLQRLGIAAAIAIFFIALAARLLPQTSMWDRLSLKAVSAGGSDAPSVSVEQKSWIGQEGVTVSMLRPSGKALIGETLADVVTEGDLIDKNARIRVIRVEGSRVVVTKA